MGLFDLFRKKDDVTKEIDDLYDRNNKQVSISIDFGVSKSADFSIKDIFLITGRGIIVVGIVNKGTFSVGDNIDLQKQDGSILPCSIRGIEMIHKICDSVMVGDNAGILLSGVKKGDVVQGDRLCKKV